MPTLTEGLAALFELTDQRIRDGVRAPATLEMQRAHGRWLAAELGGELPLEAIDEQLLEQLAGPRVPRRRFGAETLRKRLSTLRAVLALAHRRRWIPRMPAFPTIIAPWRPRQRFLKSYQDAVALFRALPRHRGEWLWLCLWTGQHASDVNRMIWADVDLDLPGNGRAASMIVRNTKNRRTLGVRVAMPWPLWRVLRARFLRDRPPPQAKIVRAWTSRSHTLLRACVRVGLQPISAIDLRHTCLSWAVRRLGITPATMAFAGHSSPAMMARTYAHALPVALAEVTRELDSMAGAANDNAGDLEEESDG